MLLFVREKQVMRKSISKPFQCAKMDNMKKQ